MKKNNKKYTFIVLGLVFLLPMIWVFLLKNSTQKISKLPILSPIEEINGQDTMYQIIEDFEFENQDGIKTTLYNETKGKMYVANFFFTSCPTICPMVTKNIQMVAEKFSARYSNPNKTHQGNPKLLFISHSVDPENDSTSKLKQYASKYNAKSPFWQMITGKKSILYDAYLNSYQISAKKDSTAEGGFIHSEKILLIDSKKRIRAIFDGTKGAKENEQIIDAIKVLLYEEVENNKHESK